jgi:hypothetical protein
VDLVGVISETGELGQGGPSEPSSLPEDARQYDDEPELNEARKSAPDDEAAFASDEYPVITELDIRMIAASLHDQGRGHVLADMIESRTGERPADEDFSPRKMQIRDPEWRKARQTLKRQRYRAERRARMTDDEKAKQIGNLQLWKANNPDKIRAAEGRRLQKKKTARKGREFVAVDLEGFDTHRYFVDDRRNYAREFHEGIARGEGQKS